MSGENESVWKWTGKDELNALLEKNVKSMRTLELQTAKMEMEYKDAMKGSAGSIEYLNSRLENLRKLHRNAFDTKEIEKYAKEIRKTDAELKKLQSIGFEDQAPAVKSRRLPGGPGMMDGLAEIPGMGRFGAAAANPYVLGGMAAAGAGKMAWDSYKESLNIDQEMAKINATAKVSKAELEKLEDQLFDMADEAKVAFEQVPAGFETILSSNGDVQQSLSITRESLKAAKANAADFETVGTGVAKTLSIIGDRGYDAAKVLDIFQAGKDFGAGEFGDFARYLPRIMSLADGLGMKFEEVAGAYSFMTKKFTTEDSAMFLQNAIQALGKTDRQKNLKKVLGVDVFDNKGSMREFAAIMEDINRSMAGMSDKQRTKALNKVGFDMQASTAIMAMAAGYQELGEGIDSAYNSAGQLNATLAATGTDADNLTELSNNWKRFKNDLGEGVAPVISSSIKNLNEAAFGDSTEARMKGVTGLLETYGETWLKVAKYTTVYGWTAMGIDAIRNSFSGSDNQETDRQRMMRQINDYRKLLDSNPLKFKAEVNLKDDAVKKYLEAYEKNPAKIHAFLGVDAGTAGAYVNKLKELYGLGDKKAMDPLKIDKDKKGKGGGSGGNADEVEKVVAGGRQVRHVTVTINTLVGEINQNITKTATEQSYDAAQIVKEGLVQAVRDAESTLDN